MLFPHKTLLSRPRNRGGFTLVELLVVIGIIAILAGVALGPITQGLEKAKESSGMQTARTIALSEFQYSVDNGSYPAGAKSGNVAAALIVGGYISDPAIFAKDKGSAYAGATTDATTIAGGMNTALTCCWDFMGVAAVAPAAATGLGTSDPDGLPALATTGQDLTPPAQGPSAAATVNANGGNPFGNNGMAVCYKSNSAAFLKAVKSGAGTYQLNTSAVNQIYNSSFSCTPANYVQLKP